LFPSRHRCPIETLGWLEKGAVHVEDILHVHRGDPSDRRVIGRCAKYGRPFVGFADGFDVQFDPAA
jgi:hypothetical protein